LATLTDLRRIAVAVVVMLLLGMALAGCGASPSDDSGSPGVSNDGGETAAPLSSGDDASDTVTVPDVAGEDGQDAVDEIDQAGLDSSLGGTAQEPSFDSSRYPTGCTVEDQDPRGGADAQPADVVTLTLDCRQTDWENQEGDDWDNYHDRFEDGFSDGCDALFNVSSDGSLYDDTQYEYTSTDCLDQDPGDGSDSAPADLPDDPEQQGYDDGFDAGCQAVFDAAGTDVLYSGQDEFTVDDCTSQN
jgi:hypothetical protein